MAKGIQPWDKVFDASNHEVGKKEAGAIRADKLQTSQVEALKEKNAALEKQIEELKKKAGLAPSVTTPPTKPGTPEKPKAPEGSK